MRLHDVEFRRNIQKALETFKTGSVRDAALHLFKTLAYPTSRTTQLTIPTFIELQKTFDNPEGKFDQTAARVDEWKSVDFAFQLTKEEVLNQLSLFEEKRFDRQVNSSYLFIVIELSKSDYTRKEISGITREINRQYNMPVMVIAKYGDHLTLSVINRRKNKKDFSKDVLEKVTLIKDISLKGEPKRSHIEILTTFPFHSFQEKETS